MCNIKYFVGIDPGIQGAIAFLKPCGEISVLPMPTILQNKKRNICITRLNQRFETGYTLHCTIEKQGMRRGQAVQSTAKTFENYGILKGILHAHYHAVSEVTPQKWKKHLEVPADKKAAQERATLLMPRAAHLWPLAKDDGKAEAAMIALYAAQKAGHEITEVYTR